MDRARERGEGRLGLIVALVLVGSAIFAGVKIVPVRVKAYEFHDTLRQETRYAAVHDEDAKVAQRLLEKAGDLEIPLSREGLVLRRTKSEIVIRAHYEQPVDLKVLTWVYRFDAEERAPIF